MRQERPVDDALDLLRPVLLGLARGELALEEQYRILGGEYPVRRVQLLVLTLLDVGVNDVGHLRIGDYGLVDLLVALHPECLHEHDQRYLAGCRGDRYDQHAILLLFHEGQRAIALPLREDLGDMQARAVPLVELDHHPVRGEVLQRYQRALRPTDDEVAAWVAQILAHHREESVQLLVGGLAVEVQVVPMQVALLGLDHDRKAADVHLLGFPLDPVLNDGELEVYRSGVVEVPQTRLHGIQRMRGAVRLLDDRPADGDGRPGVRVYQAGLLVPLPAETDLDDLPLGPVRIESDDSPVRLVRRRPHVIHYLLHPAVRVVQRGEEIVVRRDVVVNDTALSEIGLDQFPQEITPALSACSRPTCHWCR